MASYYQGVELTAEQVAQVAYQAGFRGDVLAQMTGIAFQRESRNPSTNMASAGAHRTSTNNNAATSGDYGLWQINWGTWGQQLISAGIIKQAVDLYDPVTNAKAAMFVYQKSGNKLTAWSAAAGGFTAGGNPLHGVNVAAAQQAVASAGSKGLLGQDWSSGTTASARTSADGTKSGPTSLPKDARLVQNPNGLFALFQVAPGLWIHYTVPRDGSVVISGPIEKLTREAYKAKYGISVNGGLAEELEEIPAGYGTYAGYVNSILDQMFTRNDPRRKDPEIMRVLATKAGRPDMTDAEFENLLRATTYYQTKTQGELQWNDLSAAEQQTRTNDMAARMAQAWYQYTGEQIPVADWVANGAKNGLIAIASGKMGFGQWTEQYAKSRAETNPESPWSRQLRDERENQRERGISIENTVNNLRSTLDRWGLTWDERTLVTYARGLVEKTMSDDDLNKMIRTQAKALFPWKDENMETIVAAAPWIETYNRVMERQGSLKTPEIAKALTAAEDPWTFEQKLKGTEGWRQTKNGRDEMYSAVASLGREMGFE